MRGRLSRFCSSVPKAISTGPHMERPKGIGRGALASACSSSQMYFCVTVQPGPPHSVGQFGATQPLS